MANLDLVYHVGNLEKQRVKPDQSLEGAGLSVSQHPYEWMQIARLGGGDVHQLTKPGARFLVWSKKNEAKALKWSVEHGYLEPRLKYRVCRWDDEWDDEVCMEFVDRDEAEAEAEDYEAEVEEVQGYGFGPKGREYWREAFTSEPNEGLARDFAIIFYAESGGYDGVWWDEELDVSRLSAPRGVIFQSMLPTWRVERAPPRHRKTNPSGWDDLNMRQQLVLVEFHPDYRPTRAPNMSTIAALVRRGLLERADDHPGSPRYDEVDLTEAGMKAVAYAATLPEDRKWMDKRKRKRERKLNPKALYHVTFLKHVPSIARTGLQPGRPRSLGDERFDAHREGAIFLTEGEGVPFWVRTAEKWAEEWHGVDEITLKREGVEDGFVPVVLRVLDPPPCAVDTEGSRNSPAMAFRCEAYIAPDKLEIWDGQSWVPVGTQGIDPYAAFDTLNVADAWGMDDPTGEFDTFQFKRPRPLLPPKERRPNPALTNADLMQRLKF